MVVVKGCSVCNIMTEGGGEAKQQSSKHLVGEEARV
jgi:hypothetical protein